MSPPGRPKGEYRSEQREGTPVTTNPMARTPDPERRCTDWQRRLLMSALWPVLWLQAMHVRRVTPCMSEPLGAAPAVPATDRPYAFWWPAIQVPPLWVPQRRTKVCAASWCVA